MKPSTEITCSRAGDRVAASGDALSRGQVGVGFDCGAEVSADSGAEERVSGPDRKFGRTPVVGVAAGGSDQFGRTVPSGCAIDEDFGMRCAGVTAQLHLGSADHGFSDCHGLVDGSRCWLRLRRRREAQDRGIGCRRVRVHPVVIGVREAEVVRCFR